MRTSWSHRRQGVIWSWQRGPRLRSLVGIVPLRWLILFAFVSIPLVIFLLAVFCVALVVVAVLIVLMAVPASVLYALSSRRRERVRTTTAGRPIDVEYRIISRNDRGGSEPE